MKCSKICCASGIVVGVVLFVLGLTIALLSPKYVPEVYHKQMELRESSIAYNLWIHTPIPLYFKAYLFNWTNAEEFLKNKSVVPDFEEIGPFVFKEIHDRVNLTWNDDNNTVSYNQIRRWEFVPEESKNLSVNITNLNVVAVTVANFLKEFPKLRPFINIEFNHLEDLIITQPASNWLFDGIDDKLLDYVNVIVKVLKLKKSPFPRKFGWFYNRNMSATYDGRFTIKTGADDIYNVGIMDKWNGMSTTQYYKGDCGLVNGTSGELFPPMGTVQDDIEIFVSDICSSIRLYKTGSSDIEGIKSYTYVGNNSTLDNGQFFPENKCFCKGTCAPSGARDVSPCRVAPLFFSFPHFYLADDSYINSVTGMSPNKTEHEFFIELDPVTGIPTNIKAQFQVNVFIEPISWLTAFKDLPKLYIPMLWFTEKATITPALAAEVLIIQNMPTILSGTCYGLAGIGIILIIASYLVYSRSRPRFGDSELIIPPEVDNTND